MLVVATSGAGAGQQPGQQDVRCSDGGERGHPAGGLGYVGAGRSESQIAAMICLLQDTGKTAVFME